jgi:Tfp pilus assembly protein PilZ
MSVPAIHQPYSALWRVPVVEPCLLEGEGPPASGLVCNLSMQGAYVAVQPIPRVGEHVRLSFALSEGSARMALEAVVCWQNPTPRPQSLPPGCGVFFLAPTWADRQRIEAAVRGFRG